MELSRRMRHNKSTTKLIKDTREYASKSTKNLRNKQVVGWEHKLSKQEIANDMFTTQISEEESSRLLKKDLIAIDIQLTKLVNNSNLTQKQYNAIVSLVYDIGIVNFKLSPILRLINEGNLIEAAANFRKWNTYLKVRYYKLTKLRKIEIELLTT